MALSNIFREPRREITESLIGIIVFAIVMYADWHFATWFHDVTAHMDGPDSHTACPAPLGMVFGLMILGGLWGVAVVIHAIGESICNRLANAGLEVRPKQRY